MSNESSRRKREGEFLTAGEARKAILQPTPGSEKRTFDNPGFSGEGDLNFCVHGAQRPSCRKRKKGACDTARGLHHHRVIFAL